MLDVRKDSKKNFIVFKRQDGTKYGLSSYLKTRNGFYEGILEIEDPPRTRRTGLLLLAEALKVSFSINSFVQFLCPWSHSFLPCMQKYVLMSHKHFQWRIKMNYDRDIMRFDTLFGFLTCLLVYTPNCSWRSQYLQADKVCSVQSYISLTFSFNSISLPC